MKSTKYRLFILSVIWVVFFINMVDRNLTTTLLPYIQKDLGLSNILIGFVVSSFFLTFIAGNFIGGYFTDKYGAKKILKFIVIGFSLITVLMGFVKTWVFLVMIRLALGFVEAPDTALSYGIIAKWFPIKEQGRINSIFATSSILAGILTPLIALGLIQYVGDWRKIFYIMIIPGAALFLVINYYFFDTPEKAMQSGKVNSLEYEKIIGNRLEEKVEVTDKQFIKSLLKDSNFWIISILILCQFSTGYGMGLWQTSFLLNQLNLDASEASIICMLSAIASFGGILITGQLYDKVLKRKSKMLLSVYFIILFIGYLLLSIVTSKQQLVLLIIATSIIGFANTSLLIPIMSYAQKSFSSSKVSTVIGIANGFGQVGSFIIPSLSGALIVNSVQGLNFKFVFYLFAVVSLIGIIFSRKILEQRDMEKPIYCLIKKNKFN